MLVEAVILPEPAVLPDPEMPLDPSTREAIVTKFENLKGSCVEGDEVRIDNFVITYDEFEAVIDAILEAKDGNIKNTIVTANIEDDAARQKARIEDQNLLNIINHIVNKLYQKRDSGELNEALQEQCNHVIEFIMSDLLPWTQLHIAEMRRQQIQLRVFKALNKESIETQFEEVEKIKKRKADFDYELTNECDSLSDCSDCGSSSGSSRSSNSKETLETEVLDESAEEYINEFGLLLMDRNHDVADEIDASKKISDMIWKSKIGRPEDTERYTNIYSIGECLIFRAQYALGIKGRANTNYVYEGTVLGNLKVRVNFNLFPEGTDPKYIKACKEALENCFVSSGFGDSGIKQLHDNSRRPIELYELKTRGLFSDNRLMFDLGAPNADGSRQLNVRLDAEGKIKIFDHDGVSKMATQFSKEKKATKAGKGKNTKPKKAKVKKTAKS